MFDPWYDGSNDYEGALLRTESEPPVFGDEGQREEEDMKVKIDGRTYDTALEGEEPTVVAEIEKGDMRIDEDLEKKINAIINKIQ